jgi:hypothetical protein
VDAGGFGKIDEEGYEDVDKPGVVDKSSEGEGEKEGVVLMGEVVEEGGLDVDDGSESEVKEEEGGPRDNRAIEEDFIDAKSVWIARTIVDFVCATEMYASYE